MVLTKTYQVTKSNRTLPAAIATRRLQGFSMLGWLHHSIPLWYHSTHESSNVIITLTTQESWISSDAGVRKLALFTKQCQDNNDWSDFTCTHFLPDARNVTKFAV